MPFLTGNAREAVPSLVIKIKRPPFGLCLVAPMRPGPKLTGFSQTEATCANYDSQGLLSQMGWLDIIFFVAPYCRELYRKKSNYIKRVVSYGRGATPFNNPPSCTCPA